MSFQPKCPRNAGRGIRITVREKIVKIPGAYPMEGKMSIDGISVLLVLEPATTKCAPTPIARITDPRIVRPAAQAVLNEVRRSASGLRARAGAAAQLVSTLEALTAK
jgi:hypothetical protein